MRPGRSATSLAAIRARIIVYNARASRQEPDAKIIEMVAGWPRNLDTRRATALGFKAEKSFDEIIRIHIEDELSGRIAV